MSSLTVTLGAGGGAGETGTQGDHFVQRSLVCSSDISPWVDLGSGFWQEHRRSVEIFSVLMMPIYPVFLFLASELGSRQRMKTRMWSVRAAREAGLCLPSLISSSHFPGAPFCCVFVAAAAVLSHGFASVDGVALVFYPSLL